MNLCKISSYLLIYIVFWHGNKYGFFANGASEVSESESEDRYSKSGSRSSDTGSIRSGTSRHSTDRSSHSDVHSSDEEITLDVSIKESARGYKYFFNNNIHRFVARDGYSFKKVVKGDHVIFTPGPTRELGKKVVIKKVDGRTRCRVYFSKDEPESDGFDEYEGGDRRAHRGSHRDTSRSKRHERDDASDHGSVSDVEEDRRGRRSGRDDRRDRHARRSRDDSDRDSEDSDRESVAGSYRSSRHSRDDVRSVVEEFSGKSPKVRSNFITIDVRDKESTKRVTYSYDKRADRHVFKAKEPYLFEYVYKNGLLIWKTEDGRYPDIVYIFRDDRGKPKLRVEFPEAAPPKRRREPEEEEEEEEERKVRPRKPRREVVSPAESVESALEERSVDSRRLVEDLRIPQKDRMAVVLDIKSKETTPQYTFTREDSLGTYVAHDSFAFNTVNKNNESIWSATSQKKYAYKVMIDGMGLGSSIKNVTLYLVDGTIKHYAKSNDKWFEQSNRIELDIMSRATTIQYEYVEHHDIGTYIAKHDYAFTAVKRGPYCCMSSCFQKTVDVWRAQRKETCRKVNVYLNLCLNTPSYVSVYLNKKKIKHFKEGASSNWMQISPTLELDIDKKDSCYQFHYSGYDQIRSYVTNYDFAFTRVTQNNAEIWKAKGDKYANMVMMNGDGNSVPADRLTVILLNGRKIYYSKEGNMWTKSDFFPPFELDIDDTYSTKYIDYVEDEETKISTFTAKHGFLIRSVVQDGIIWFTDNPKDYAEKVQVTEDKNDVLVFLKSGKRRQFKRPEAGQSWSEVRPKPLDKKTKRHREEDRKPRTRDGRRSKTPALILDLECRTSFPEFSYRHKRDRETYTTKDKYLFTGIQVGHDPAENDKIWFPKDSDFYVSKVEVDLSDPVGYINDVKLTCADGSVKQFIKVGPKKKWSEVVVV